MYMMNSQIGDNVAETIPIYYKFQIYKARFYIASNVIVP